MDFSICDHTVGFPKYSHIYIYMKFKKLTMCECWQRQRQLELRHLIELSPCSVVARVSVLSVNMDPPVDIFTSFGLL